MFQPNDKKHRNVLSLSHQRRLHAANSVSREWWTLASLVYLYLSPNYLRRLSGLKEPEMLEKTNACRSSGPARHVRGSHRESKADTLCTCINHSLKAQASARLRGLRGEQAHTHCPRRARLLVLQASQPAAEWNAASIKDHSYSKRLHAAPERPGCQNCSAILYTRARSQT